MSVFKLKGFNAECDVLGTIREVTYSHGRLQIEGLNLNEAKAAVDLLATGLKVTALDGEEKTLTYVEEKSAAAPADPPAKTEAVKKPPKAAAKKGKAKEEPAKEASPKKEEVEEVPIVDVDTPSKTVASGSKAEAPPKEEKEESNVVDLGEKRAANGELSTKLAGAGNLKDIIMVLIDSGIKAEADIIAKCEEVQAEVPVLKRIPNIGERVKRVMARISA